MAKWKEHNLLLQEGLALLDDPEALRTDPDEDWGPYGPTRLDDLPYMTQEVVSKLMEYSLETGALAPDEGNGHHPAELWYQGDGLFIRIGLYARDFEATGGNIYFVARSNSNGLGKVAFQTTISHIEDISWTNAYLKIKVAHKVFSNERKELGAEYTPKDDDTIYFPVGKHRSKATSMLADRGFRTPRSKRMFNPYKGEGYSRLPI